MMRSIAWAASLVCRVEKTRWPVSARVRASWMDSRSRISPTRRTSGSSRRAERSARSNEGLSRPTSRWLTAERLCSCTYSMGSSMVRMCSERVSLMRAMMEARVVDLPDPVGPVSSTRPRGSRASHSATGGSPSSSKVGMSEGIIRRASAISPFWWNALPRSRARSCQVSEKSTSWCSSRMASCSGRQHAVDELFDLGAREHRRALERPQASVDPDPWLGTADQQQVRTLLVPEDLEPGVDSFDVGGSRCPLPFSFDAMSVDVKAKAPGPEGRALWFSIVTLVLTTQTPVQPRGVVEVGAARCRLVDVHDHVDPPVAPRLIV